MPRSVLPDVPTFGRRRRRGTSMALAVALTVSGLGVALAGSPAQAAVLPYQDASLPTATRVADLLGRMTLDDKIGQMTQAERAVVSPSDLTTYRLGSVLSGGGSAPSSNTTSGWADLYDGLQRGAMATSLQIPMLYGIDAVHGNNNALGATIFPHNIGLGATRDPQLAQDIGRAVAEEVSATGIDWTFAPCLCAVRDDRWGRTYESFGEDPAITSAMTTIVTGFQGERLGGSASVLATAKHFIADGGTLTGDDQGDARISEAELRAIHLPPFKAAIAKGVGSVMVSYSSWNGVKMHGNKYLLTDVLKGELGFTGFVVSDWAAIDQLDGAQGFTVQEVATSVNAGIDMVMVPNDYKTFLSYLRQAVQSGADPDHPHRRRRAPHPHEEVRAGPVREALRGPLLRLHGRQHRAPRARPHGGAEVAGHPEEHRRPAARGDRRQGVRGRQEREQHRQPERWLDPDLAGRERCDRAGHHDPRGHPAGPGRRSHDDVRRGREQRRLLVLGGDRRGR